MAENCNILKNHGNVEEKTCETDNYFVKLPRSLIVNLARNNVNLEMLVNPDVDVVKYQYYIFSYTIYFYYC